MKLSELNYNYPEQLVATEPKSDFRILFSDFNEPAREITKSELLRTFQSGDLLIINNTKVSKRRIFANENLEVLFINPISHLEWEVLFPARSNKIGSTLTLPGGIEATLLKKGLPQIVRLSKSVDEGYFLEYGEPALPPYIQKARGERHAKSEDGSWYQTEWAEKLGSSAAPTASLHFSAQDLEDMQSHGVQIEKLTLHVGLGTFLPIKTDDVTKHVMHKEWAEILTPTIKKIKQTKKRGGRVIALGTTVTRALESWAINAIPETSKGFQGETDLFLLPGHEFKVVDVLMTNFHQPGSTLLALVCAFAGKENVLKAYSFAVENKFRLFSYGDLSVWTKPKSPANLQ